VTLPLLSKNPDQRRVAETLNNVLTFQHDDSRIRTAAEVSAGVRPLNYAYPPGHVRRYGAQGGGTYGSGPDDTAAFQAALNVAAVGYGISAYADTAQFRVTAPLVFNPNAAQPIHFWCHRGARLICDHNGDGIVNIATNENFSGHCIENWIVDGPNTFLPAGGYTPTSTGAGCSMDDNTLTNTCTANNCTFYNVWFRGFKFGVAMRASINNSFFGCEFRFNQYGVFLDGGQTNVNHWYGCNIRENRVAGLYSQGTSGGSLSVATANTFIGCLFETNIPYPFVSGGTPPTDSTAIYLNNSYDFVFVGCYSENHAAAIYLTGQASGHQFLKHRVAGGTGRFDQIILSGPSCNCNEFDLKQASSQSATEVHYISLNASQLYNRISGEGVNIILANTISPPDYSSIRPSQNFVPSYGIGLIRMPTWGYAGNIQTGTTPGALNGIGTTTATLNVYGKGEIQFGNGLTAATTVTTITNAAPGSFIVLRNVQNSFALGFVSNTGIILKNRRSIVLDKIGQELILWAGSDGNVYEVGRNFTDRLVGTAALVGASTSVAVSLAGLGFFNEPDTNYVVQFWVNSFSGGTPAAGSLVAYATVIATTGFTLNVQTAPGVGVTVNYGWEAIRLDT
jgi:hypothetical protein